MFLEACFLWESMRATSMWFRNHMHTSGPSFDSGCQTPVVLVILPWCMLKLHKDVLVCSLCLATHNDCALAAQYRNACIAELSLLSYQLQIPPHGDGHHGTECIVGCRVCMCLVYMHIYLSFAAPSGAKSDRFPLQHDIWACCVQLSLEGVCFRLENSPPGHSCHGVCVLPSAAGCFGGKGWG